MSPRKTTKKTAPGTEAATVTGPATPNPELINALRDLERDRGLSFEVLIEALEAALVSAYKRNFAKEAEAAGNPVVLVDRNDGSYRVFARRAVVEEVTDPIMEISKADAGESFEIGSNFDVEVTPKEFGRIAAQTAKQVIVQRIREAERDTVYNKYAAKLNDIVKGTVQRFEQRNMYVLLDGKDEAMLPLSEQVQRENFRINDFIRAYVLDVRKSPKGPTVVLSRAAEGLVQRLLEFEVPEIEDGIVEIMAIAREPGSRSKVAVRSNRQEIDPIGACLGPKSSRIANVSDELRGEKIDIIPWQPDPVAFIMMALQPAKVISAELFEDDGVALVVVPDYQLSLAIGREGQNVRLAARLTGWRLDIASESEADEARERYLAERAERAAEVPAAVEPEVEEEVVAEGEEGTPAVALDEELIRRLEEFKRERLGE